MPYMSRALCRTGKRRYPSVYATTNEIERLRDSYAGDPDKRPRSYYACYFCSGFHVSSKKPREG